MKASKNRDQTKPAQSAHAWLEAFADQDRNDRGKEKKTKTGGETQHYSALEDFDSERLHRGNSFCPFAEKARELCCLDRLDGNRRDVDHAIGHRVDAVRDRHAVVTEHNLVKV